MNNPPHILTARLERAIVVNEHAKYTAHCCGDCEREERLRLELDILNKQYWTSHGYCFHHNSQETNEAVLDSGLNTKALRPDTYSQYSLTANRNRTPEHEQLFLTNKAPPQNSCRAVEMERFSAFPTDCNNQERTQ